MMTMKMREDIIKCDFLIVGGGIAGMQAAITGSALGMDVVVAEKADTRRSGWKRPFYLLHPGIPWR